MHLNGSRHFAAAAPPSGGGEHTQFINTLASRPRGQDRVNVGRMRQSRGTGQGVPASETTVVNPR